MKRAMILLQILFITACVKEQPCASERVHCTHTIYYGYLACPDPDNPGKYRYSNCKYYTETAEMTACDTSTWLEEARLFDESRKYEPNSDSWNEFTRQYPNQCGCQ